MAIEYRSSTTRKLGAAAIGAGIVVIPFLGLFLAGVEYSLLWTAVIALGAIALVPFVYEIYYKSGSPDPFAPIFWVAPAFFFIYGAHTVLRLLNNNFSFRGDYTASVHPSVIMLQVLMLASIGLIAIYAGYYWDQSRSFASHIPTFRSGWSTRRAWVAIVVLMILGLVGYFSLSGIGSGPRSHLAKGSSKFAFIAVNLLNTASILVIADNFISWPSTKITEGLSVQSVSKGVVSVGIVGFNTLILWTLGGRARAFGILIVSLFLIHYLFHRFSMISGMSLYGIIKLIPSWAVGLITSLIALDFADFSAELVHPYLFRMSEFTSFNNIVILFAGIPQRLGFQYGKTFLSAFFALVPYQPVPQTQVVYFQAFMSNSGENFGVPITLLGELYLNFWIPGIVFGLFFVGIIMRLVYNRLVVEQPGPASLVLFATLTNSFLIGGNFSNSAPALGLKVLPMVVVLYYITHQLNDLKATTST